MAFQITQQGRQICVSQETFPIILQSLPFPRYPSDRACLQAANETHQVPDGTTEDDQQTDTPSICFQNSNKVRQALGWEKKWSLHGCLLLQNFVRDFLQDQVSAAVCYFQLVLQIVSRGNLNL